MRPLFTLRSFFQVGRRRYSNALVAKVTSSWYRNFAAAISSMTLAAAVILVDERKSNCHGTHDNDVRIKNKHSVAAATGDSVVPSNLVAPSSQLDRALTRSFIADAAAVIAPSVVNIVAPSHGFIPMAQAGSGFIITEDGFVATNAHVVSSAKVGGIVEVTLYDTRKLQGRVHSMDKQSDIAIIKLEDGKNLPVAQLGSSAKLRSGEFVVAVGSPLQLQNSVTYGIVSSPARHSSELGMTKHGTDFIQTDAAINVGNSGGPLVNLDGEVIGINSMKAQGYDGVSFAIPIDTAWRVIKQLIDHKRVIRPFVGLKMSNFVELNLDGSKRRPTDSPGLHSRSSDSTSVVIIEVVHGSPAEQAGLQSGDIIIAIDGRPVRHTKDVLDAIGVDIGARHELRVLKVGTDREERTVSLVTAPDRSAHKATPDLHHGPSPKRHF